MADFWRNRRVFLTGHTGFKGAWLALWLQQLGARVTGFALAPHTEPNLFELVGGAGVDSIIGDIRDTATLQRAVLRADPQVVVHMAAQALVRESYRDPLGTYGINVLGTGAVLEACRSLSALECALVVTSDKVYENIGLGRPFNETDRLGGHDPYSNSKACAELLTGSFRDSFYRDGPPLASARAGNVIGGGDWSTDRLIPDCVRALAGGTPVRLRYPDAIRPWQHVLEPLSGYLTLCQAMIEHPDAVPHAVNFGPEPASFSTVKAVVDAFSARFSGKPGWEKDAGDHPPEAGALTLSSALAAQTLGWHPRLNVTDTVTWSVDWYRAHTARENMLEFSRSQIERYQALPSRLT